MQISWQVQYFGHGDGLPRALDMNRDLWTCGSLSEFGGFIERKLRFGILMLSFNTLLLRNALASASRCESDFMAGAALCERQGADFAAGTASAAFCESRSADFAALL